MRMLSACRRRGHPQQFALLVVGDLTPEIVQLLRLSPGTVGALVDGVEPVTPAANAGIRRGDLITEINRQPIRSAGDVIRVLRQLRSGQTAFVRLTRQGNEVFVTMRTE
jgi:serine protease Do